MSHQANVDAVVIGAGIAGTSIAYFLSNHANVVVLEREPHPGVHSTGRSAALFSETYGPSQVRALTRASRSFFERAPAGFTENPLLTPRGVLVIANTEQSAQIESTYHDIQACTPVRVLTTQEMRAIVPVLEPQFAAVGLFEPDAADIDVNSVHQGFIRGLKARGSQLECGVDVCSIERAQNQWSIEIATPTAQRRVLRTPLLINAAGAWADDVATQAGVRRLGIEPRRRSAFLFAPPQGVSSAHWPFVTNANEEFYFKPDAGLLLGSPANAEPVHAHDVQPEELDIAMAIHRIEEATTMRIHRPTRAWAGLRSFVSDGGLVGGFDPIAPGFFWVAALGGYGIQTCAAMGEACAHLALGRALPLHLTDAGLSPAMIGLERLQAATARICSSA